MYFGFFFVQLTHCYFNELEFYATLSKVDAIFGYLCAFAFALNGYSALTFKVFFL